MADAADSDFKALASMWLFVRAFAKAVVFYVNENSAPKQHELKGVGIDKDVRLAETLPTIIDLKRAIPKRCFESCAATSLYYAVKDAVLVAASYWVFAKLHDAVPALYWPTMPAYWAIQGTLLMAVFVVGHDCGHGSFSKYGLLNDVVGQLMHGFLFCPYYMWKLSHRHHHKHTGDFDKDEVFYPVKLSPGFPRNRILTGFAFGFGWFIYLIQGYKPRSLRHYTPNQPMFFGHFFGCACSMGVLACMVYFLGWFALKFGFLALVNYYVIPILIFASYLVIITFLHHTEMGIPWYATTEWDFVRGQLSTIDRDYGMVHDVIHNIGTHQMHHMFSIIPHYRLEEATRHFRAAFPDLVRKCDEPILPSFIRMFQKYEAQGTVDENTKIHRYH